MCIFSGKIESVSGTKIFSRHTRKGKQCIVYSMSLKTKNDVAMILPIPTSSVEEDSVEFVDLSSNSGFFDQLDALFPKPNRLRSRGLCRGLTDSLSTLKVHAVGSFEASFVPTVDDFDRLDERFTLPRATWDRIPSYSRYGFVVFKLKAGNAKVHPMAFEFETGMLDRIFFPTMHIHDGDINRREYFDHQLYHQGGDEDDWEKSSLRMIAKSEHGLRTNDWVYRRSIGGMQDNQDIIVKVGKQA